MRDDRLWQAMKRAAVLTVAAALLFGAAGSLFGAAEIGLNALNVSTGGTAHCGPAKTDIDHPLLIAISIL
jgi:hypothetical protein